MKWKDFVERVEKELTDAGESHDIDISYIDITGALMQTAPELIVRIELGELEIH